LARETNALIDANREIVERARTHVGNLAHALKTPLSVMVNEGPPLAPTIRWRRQVKSRPTSCAIQVARHLRARAASQPAWPWSAP
jgi:hypothetical protein